jgi:hypothetical protein
MFLLLLFCLSFRSAAEESAFVVAFLVVIPEGNLLLSLPFLSGISAAL